MNARLSHGIHLPTEETLKGTVVGLVAFLRLLGMAWEVAFVWCVSSFSLSPCHHWATYRADDF